MTRKINKVAVLGGGTMGGGIAGLVAQTGHQVVLLEINREAAAAAKARMVSGRPPALETPEAADRVTVGSFDDDMGLIADCDWICEAVVEDLEIKRSLLARVEAVRKDGSIVSTNTSGIRLADITQCLPERLARDMAVTHFFNPVKVMRLVELVPGVDTADDVIPSLAAFCGGVLGKGPVYAKDTVNFIGNRIGCYWMLSGLHIGGEMAARGLNTETMDALMSAPVGIPPTGLYGLIDLVGLDVMDLVARNLAANLAPGDGGLKYATLPPAEAQMLARGQLGRKTGGGFYKMIKNDDGSRTKETFEPATNSWRPAVEVTLAEDLTRAETLLFPASPSPGLESEFATKVLGGTLAYAAGLVPEIADDIVNIDRAMRWGFAWKEGPFQLMDRIGPAKLIARLKDKGKPLPKMLQVLRHAGAPSFYRNDGTEFLGVDGAWAKVPAE
ncbi:3-hydroxyacyl-CoA dehydrogenase [fadN-fadA-fadE operon] / Enoyl-CoA hydratase [fadN-fadA-fadE operon] [hydrothermal vent metagenome]|uniref:3-hydroxyacyl-CoA dehydrogenase [fadN-fadA-fadE operon] / Enoyl-CoA hydratase [fadN-fadA-fadE operon] n=1 Tax=hydrothermal vent metagenome TaxID=652676 RepID=A0A3B0TIL2_9ZZZZ